MKRILSAAVLLSFVSFSLSGEDGTFSISGKVTDDAGEGIPWAGLVLKETGIWTVSDDEGCFVFGNVLPGTYTFEVSCLGYVTERMSLDVRGDMEYLRIILEENTLALEEVTVTARQGEDAMNTTLVFGRNALDHLQMSNVADVAALLPGGKTVNPDLTASNVLSVRDGGVSAGNAAFGTAIEVDGVRLGNNASFGAMSGIDTRNIQVQNIESIEVLTGVPSAEYGDLNGGLVRIHTKKGRTPVNVVFAVNPRTWSVSADKGIGLPEGKGVLNVGAEWTRATRGSCLPHTHHIHAGESRFRTATHSPKSCISKQD